MKFNKNIKVDDMKEKVSAKIARHYGRRMSRLFYKFLVSSNQCKFTEMELVNDEDVEPESSSIYKCTCPFSRHYHMQWPWGPHVERRSWSNVCIRVPLVPIYNTFSLIDSIFQIKRVVRMPIIHKQGGLDICHQAV